MSRERYSKQLAWYQQLQEGGRVRLDVICAHILNHAALALDDLNGETLLRKSFAHEEALPEFYRKEQHRVSELAYSQPLNNQIELSTLLSSVLFQIRAGEINASDLYYLPSEIPKGGPDPWSFKWFESAVETASYLIYAAQIEFLLQSGALEQDRHWSPVLGDTNNEILLLLTRQVIISVGGMDESLHGKKNTHPKREELRLSDVLVESVTPEQVKEIYKDFLYPGRPSDKILQQFLKLLKIRNYYSSTCKLTNDDLQAIGRNDFDKSFSYNGTSRRSLPENLNIPPFNKVPPVK